MHMSFGFGAFWNAVTGSLFTDAVLVFALTERVLSILEQRPQKQFLEEQQNAARRRSEGDETAIL